MRLCLDCDVSLTSLLTTNLLKSLSEALKTIPKEKLQTSQFLQSFSNIEKYEGLIFT